MTDYDCAYCLGPTVFGECMKDMLSNGMDVPPAGLQSFQTCSKKCSENMKSDPDFADIKNRMEYREKRLAALGK